MQDVISLGMMVAVAALVFFLCHEGRQESHDLTDDASGSWPIAKRLKLMGEARFLPGYIAPRNWNVECVTKPARLRQHKKKGGTLKCFPSQSAVPVVGRSSGR